MPPWSRGRWLDLVHPEDRARVRTSFAAKMLDGRYDEEYRVACRDGTMRWVRDRGVPVRNPQGVVVLQVGGVLSAGTVNRLR